ncbi:MAG: GDP-mannose 4,6-dehydratase [Planctomycetaceae bacterium]
MTRKITRAVTRIREGFGDKLLLGNLDASRRLGIARDYVEAMWLMLQQDELATTSSVPARLIRSASSPTLCLTSWSDADEFVEIDPRFLRPSEVDLLLGDATKAREELGWEPRTTFRELVEEMVDSDWELAREERRALSRSLR